MSSWGRESEGVDFTKNKDGLLHPEPPGAGRSGGTNGPGLSYVSGPQALAAIQIPR